MSTSKSPGSHRSTFDNLIATTDPLGNVSSATYDSAGRKIAMSDPDMGGWSYSYDVLGQLKTQTDAKGQVTGSDVVP